MTKTIDYNLDLSVFFMMLKDHGATHVRCEFHGGGDSGGVVSAFAYRVDETNTEGMPDIGTHQVNSMLSDLVTPYTYEYDWWNNEGGHGTITVNLATLEYETVYNICGEDKAEYEEDENGDMDWDSAEPDYDYDTYHGSGTIKID